ncbi:hypothetical protein [Lentibacillus cibarius]|uniref:Uncharacterized protein n=1 Tax=Lentibacillus cibarius TaxID=2583219 RepID=A0A5S3QFN1_9BACI|nr:hypothetical protein [Lentibacillus cibarius]RYG70892.1 hypothetical protein EU245_15325 [Lentibacillus lipolyticus]TMN18797.1 hypothetical protein FFL34_17750 [Lentibacillus cibarius]TMN18825.1 hypothetical protein FFL34_17915 [Lentibacillus cibarius]
MICHEQAIQRYYRILTTYLTMAKHLDSCSREDEAFYQDMCVLLAKKIKAIQAELADNGFAFSRELTVPCGDAFVADEQEKKE